MVFRISILFLGKLKSFATNFRNIYKLQIWYSNRGLVFHLNLGVCWSRIISMYYNIQADVVIVKKSSFVNFKTQVNKQIALTFDSDTHRRVYIGDISHQNIFKVYLDYLNNS